MKFLPVVFLLLVSTAFSAETVADVFKTAKRVLFLGDSITWNGGYVADFTAWAESGPRKSGGVVFINAGLPSENVSGLTEEGHAGGKFPRPDLRERLSRVLAAVKPDLVFVCYGMNDGIQQPFDRARAEAYVRGMTNVKQVVQAAGAKIVFLTPPVFDGKRVPARAYYTEVLERYSQWLAGQRKNGWLVVDVNAAMTRGLAEQRVKDPEFSVQADGVHPDAAGHWMIAKTLIAACGGEEDARAASAAEMLGAKKIPPEFLKLHTQRMTVLRDAWLTKTGHTRPEMPKGLPFEQAEAKAHELQDQADKLLP